MSGAQLQTHAGCALAFAVPYVGAELRHPPVRSCGVQRSSSRIPNPGVWGDPWKRLLPRQRPEHPSGCGGSADREMRAEGGGGAGGLRAGGVCGAGRMGGAAGSGSV